MKTNIHVLVISDDGWSWILAWLQIGLETVSCLPTGTRADEQLKQVEGVPTMRDKVKRYGNPNEGLTNNINILCLHISSSALLADQIIIALVRTHLKKHQHLVFLSVAPYANLQLQAQGFFNHDFTWQQLRHVSLGGLTSARILLGWSKLGADVAPGKVKQPIRPLGRFLDPAARLVQWRTVQQNTSDCWKPNAPGAKPYPWPWATGPEWVETHTVFFDSLVQRRFTDKERCQLVDLRHDWHPLLAPLWSWNNGCAPPLRLLVEFIMAARTSLRRMIGQEKLEPGETTGTLSIKNDWGRNRAPWVGHEPGDSSVSMEERVKYFGWIWDSSDFADVSIACKGDDADVNLKLWAIGGDGPGMEEARTVIRKFLWRVWLRKICVEGLTWLRNNNNEANRLAMADCVERCIHSSWWNWETGSRLFFWRWPVNWFHEARDGAAGFHISRPRPRRQFPQVPIREEWVMQKDIEKLEKLLRRGYVINGECITTVPRFPVPKGKDDIRVVWDLAKNGVNETMYTPSFFLATMPTYLRRVGPGFYGGDFDIGEQFHNYILHASEQPYCGVEIPKEIESRLTKEGFVIHKYMRWARLVFGWQSSPYLALRMFARALEIAKGHPADEHSSFHFAQVSLNLPGSGTYDPGMPRIMKKTSSGKSAADIVTFYDDGRVFGPTEEIAHSALRQITSRLQYLGNQDAPRKRRLVSQRPGAWAGGIAYSDQGILRAFVSAEKWTKAKEFLNWIWESIHSETGLIERVRFRSGKGFLVYMSTCYEFLQPYLKGFHLSEDAWRLNRDQEGWKQKHPDEFETIQHGMNDDYNGISNKSGEQDLVIDQNNIRNLNEQAPQQIRPVPRLTDDVKSLLIFFGPDTPVQVIVRPVEGASFVAYGGGDASGEGFGGHLQPLGLKPLLRRGFWCPTDADESSNWRELRNLIDTVREEARSGRLVGREVWMATDNSTAANAYHKGSSTSRLLHEMVTELRLLTIEGNFILRLYHIAGTRMIESGIDALSRGELHISSLESAVATLMPLHQSPLERSPSLFHWLSSWLDESFKISKPNEWFYEAHQSGEYQLPQQSQTWVWDLPPAAAIHVIEELGIARLKRHEVLRGVVLIPNLLSHEWHRRFSRIVDVYITLSPGAIPEWPIDMYESLTVGLYFPLFRHRPWDWKRVPFLVPFGISMSKMYKEGLPACQNAWCPTCYKALPGENFFVFRAKDDEGEDLFVPGEELDYMEARAGDHLVCPFECDTCSFHRIKGVPPNMESGQDKLLLTYIRRANLDAFWSRRPSTVRGLNNLFAEQIAVGEKFGFSMFESPGPFGRRYDSGMKAAIGILSRSQRPGLHEETMKFSSVRKARTLHTDLYNASARAAEGAMVWRSERARFVTTKAPTDTAWFNAFMTGYRARVGERRKQDAAISIDLMVAIQNTLEQDWQELSLSGDEQQKRNIAEHGAYYLFVYCGSLRGFEGPKVTLGDLRRQIAPPGSEQARLHGAHIGLPLSGRFKARSQHIQEVLIPIAYETASGLQPGVWAERIIKILDDEGITTGWLFRNPRGEQQKMAHFDEDFYDRLFRIQQERPALFTEGINIQEDYHLARSFRRGATTRATAAGVSSSDIDYINRWNIGADSSGGPMRVLYTEKTQLTKTFLRFSLAL